MPPSQLNVLVCGATGNQGGAVARALLQRGHSVSALTRDPSKPAARAIEAAGASLAGGDLTDRADCERVLEGVDAAFLVATPYEAGFEVEVQQGTTFAEAAAATGLGHLVYSSVAGCRDRTGLPNFETKLQIEQRIEQLGVPHTFVAPAYLMENMLLPDSLAALAGGRFALPLPPDRPLQQIGVDDVGTFAALALEQRDTFSGKRIEIAGDELTGAEAARILGEALDSPVEYLHVPLEAVREQNEVLAAMFKWLDEVGFGTDIQGLRSKFPEAGWQDFRTWAGKQDLPRAG